MAALATYYAKSGYGGYLKSLIGTVSVA
jgi:hypothetical protein